ncbi:c-type cytochrome [Ideonella sp.]|uniref:c-type cytochrome n=1 Tax=Ideonella sp. TaxID=1929293 RepID=UPI002B48FB84|nr:c-type cytochrome [Ideonella sp.]HJV68479.1 c-type cytochrome [Ideonella sp.]
MKTPAAFSITAVLVATLAAPMTSSVWANEPAAAPKADLAKGQAMSTNVCGACHTADGSRGLPANPILQGQHPEYLAKQLTEFKAGKRTNPIMQGMAAPLSDEDIRNVAAFYASKQAKPGFAKSKETVALGEKIYRAGIADKQVPACAGCHSPTGAGIPAQYPRIGGQHADYVSAQMQAFRDHKRTNSVPMQAIAARMNNDEIAAVSDYIAGLR